jgi:chemotaxis protein histidine kinase CheA
MSGLIGNFLGGLGKAVRGSLWGNDPEAECAALKKQFGRVSGELKALTNTASGSDEFSLETAVRNLRISQLQQDVQNLAKQIAGLEPAALEAKKKREAQAAAKEEDEKAREAKRAKTSDTLFTEEQVAEVVRAALKAHLAASAPPVAAEGVAASAAVPDVTTSHPQLHNLDNLVKALANNVMEIVQSTGDSSEVESPQPQPLAQPLARPQPLAQPLARPQPQPQPLAQPLARPQPLAQPLARPQPLPQPLARPLAQPLAQPLARPQPNDDNDDMESVAGSVAESVRDEDEEKEVVESAKVKKPKLTLPELVEKHLNEAKFKAFNDLVRNDSPDSTVRNYAVFVRGKDLVLILATAMLSHYGKGSEPNLVEESAAIIVGTLEKTNAVIPCNRWISMTVVKELACAAMRHDPPNPNTRIGDLCKRMCSIANKGTFMQAPKLCGIMHTFDVDDTLKFTIAKPPQAPGGKRYFQEFTPDSETIQSIEEEIAEAARDAKANAKAKAKAQANAQAKAQAKPKGKRPKGKGKGK